MEKQKIVDNYSKAYKEVIEVLSFMPKESVDKIPQTILDTFKAKMDKDYDFNVDINKSFEEQILLDETKAIFANIFRDYWATPYQRERIVEKEKYDRQKLEYEKRDKYNPDDLFIKRKTNNKEEEPREFINNNLPMEIKKEKFFEKMLKFIKNFLKIGRG